MTPITLIARSEARNDAPRLAEYKAVVLVSDHEQLRYVTYEEAFRGIGAAYVVWKAIPNGGAPSDTDLVWEGRRYLGKPQAIDWRPIKDTPSRLLALRSIYELYR